MPNPTDKIIVKGARQHNLKDINVEIPRDQLVVITGLSGSGKSQAIHALEDLGYFCVDNHPSTLIPTLANLTALTGGVRAKTAVVVDVREGKFLSRISPAPDRQLHSTLKDHVVTEYSRQADIGISRDAHHGHGDNKKESLQGIGVRENPCPGAFDKSPEPNARKSQMDDE